jgi:hypothetical protein
MASRRNAGSGERSGAHRHASDKARREAVTSPADQLDYIADMVQELKAMSARANCQALTELLELAYQEARQRRRAG